VNKIGLRQYKVERRTKDSQLPADQPARKPQLAATRPSHKAVVGDEPAFEKQFGGIKVNILVGDMTEINSDALVIPQFHNRLSTGGVSGCVKRQGGKRGIAAYEEHLKQHRDGLEYGTAVLVNSGCEKWPLLIHIASVMPLEIDTGVARTQGSNVVELSFYNALVAANEKGLKHIVAPALGTNHTAGLGFNESAQAMRSALERFVKNKPNSSLKQVTITLFRRGHDLPRYQSMFERDNKTILRRLDAIKATVMKVLFA